MYLYIHIDLYLHTAPPLRSVGRARRPNNRRKTNSRPHTYASIYVCIYQSTYISISAPAAAVHRAPEQP